MDPTVSTIRNAADLATACGKSRPWVYAMLRAGSVPGVEGAGAGPYARVFPLPVTPELLSFIEGYAEATRRQKALRMAENAKAGGRELGRIASLKDAARRGQQALWKIRRRGDFDTLAGSEAFRLARELQPFVDAFEALSRRIKTTGAAPPPPLPTEDEDDPGTGWGTNV